MARKLRNIELNRLSVDEFIHSKKNNITLIADNIRSAHNIGSLFRTADAFLIEQIILIGISATPPQKDILKAALGAEKTVDWLYFKTQNEAIEYLKSKEIKIISVEQTSESKMITDWQWNDENIALVMGNEIDGVSEEFIEASDTILEIPQYGTKHSFNVSVSAGIVLWELLR